MNKISTAQWAKMSAEEKIAFIDKEPQPRWTKYLYKFSAEIQVKAHTEEEARNMVVKLARGNYLLVNNLQLK